MAQASAQGSDLLRQPALEDSDLTWRVLTTLDAFRLLLAAVLLVLFFASAEERIFGDRYPGLFAATAAGYLVFAAVSWFAIRRRWIPAGPLAIVQITADIAAIVTLMHASGGIGSGLGGLLIVFVGAGSLIVPLQIPATFAALATLAILAEQFFSQLAGYSDAGSYSAAGVLGAIIFAISMAARPLANRIQASEALAEQRGIDLANLSQLNDYIVQHLRESIVVLDASDSVRLMNASAARLLGVPPSVQGIPVREITAALADYIEAWRREPQRRSHVEFTLLADGGSARLVAHLAPLGEGGERNGPILVFLEDPSYMNARVQQSKLASLGRLSASIAHEIRNPVGAMSHAGQLLAESKTLGAEDVRLTEIIRAHADRVSHIIENVLQLSRRESSHPERFDLGPWLEEFVGEFAATQELEPGQLRLEPVPAGLEILMDPSHLHQVLWNLCDNAVKYAEKAQDKQVELRAGRFQRTQQPYVEVLDHGHGVPPANVDRIFEPFFTDRQGGTGLGLYISRELAELNRASLVYQPREGGGSIFRIAFADPGRWNAVEDK
jgi:two-component system sensor histidine kinase PilS (NtrC family)